MSDRRLTAAVEAWRRLSQEDRNGALFIVGSAAADHATDATGASLVDQETCVRIAVALSTIYELAMAAEEQATEQPATTRNV